MPSSTRSTSAATSAKRHPEPTAAFDSAQFALSVAELEEINSTRLALLPEVAFVGRSNAGKSSVINVLTGQRRLAFASKTPGRTQLLNFFTLCRRVQTGSLEPCAYLVDLPGYGFARVDNATRSRWDRLVGGYLQTRRMLVGVVLVIDARRGLMPTDDDLLAWMMRRSQPEKLHLHLLLNKSDQLNASQRRELQGAAEARANALPMPTTVQLFSAMKRTGVDELRSVVAHVLQTSRV
ncbi:MAG: ribosome biogenesis GTP-binding protein YihA/YsxC [Gemmatimonadota bacterium]